MLVLTRKLTDSETLSFQGHHISPPFALRMILYTQQTVRHVLACSINQPKQQVSHWNIELFSQYFRQHLGLSPSSQSAAACVSASTASSVFLILVLSVSAVRCEPHVAIPKYYFIVKEIGRGCRWKPCASFHQHDTFMLSWVFYHPVRGGGALTRLHLLPGFAIGDSRTALFMHLPEMSSM